MNERFFESDKKEKKKKMQDYQIKKERKIKWKEG